MDTLTRTYANDGTSNANGTLRERAGGPRGNRPETLNNAAGYFMSNKTAGSHMPIDTQIHWDWRNPLNILPAFMALLFLLTVVELLVR